MSPTQIMARARALATEIHKETGSRVEISIGLPPHLYEHLLAEVGFVYVPGERTPIMWGGIKFEAIK